MGRCAARLRRLWVTEGSRHVFQKALAADSTVAILFAAASIASVSASFELIRQVPKVHEPSRPAIVVALLAVTLPLALRRRLPLFVAATVIVAFVAARVALAPDVPFLAA